MIGIWRAIDFIDGLADLVQGRIGRSPRREAYGHSPIVNLLSGLSDPVYIQFYMQWTFFYVLSFDWSSNDLHIQSQIEVYQTSTLR